jgi:hypothetical protein
MITVNSLSGGKTSSYIYAHYPADYNVFAIVCNNDPKCAHPDKKLMQMANDRLQKYSSHWDEFIGTPEHPSIVKTIFDLEQKYGREITWLRGISFDDLCIAKKAIPNMTQRFCTTETKIRPIFEFCHYHLNEKPVMRIGYRYDEMERKERFTTEMKHSDVCEIRANSKVHRWKVTDWRIGAFPLIDDKITHFQVYQWAETTGIYFAKDSNCQMCFWKQEMQLRKNWDDAPNQMKWASNLEKIVGRAFLETMSLEDVKEIGLQLDFFFGGGSGCSAGGCTD